jgi:hypothetical protein
MDHEQPAEEIDSSAVATLEDAKVEQPELDSFSWQASEYIHHDKKPGWFVILFLITAVLVGVAVLFQQWFSIPVVLVMAIAVLVYAVKPPRVLNYSLDESGITIDAKHYPYPQFRSFAVVQDVGWHSIDLEPTQRFMPRLTILFDNDDFSTIVGVLSESLPEVDRQPDWVERATRFLKF